MHTKILFFSNEEPFKLLEGDDEELEEIKKNANIKDCLNIEDDSENSDEASSDNSKDSDNLDPDNSDPDNSKNEGEQPIIYIIIIVLSSCINIFLVAYLIFIKCGIKNELKENDENILPAPMIN